MAPAGVHGVQQGAEGCSRVQRGAAGCRGVQQGAEGVPAGAAAGRQAGGRRVALGRQIGRQAGRSYVGRQAHREDQDMAGRQARGWTSELVVSFVSHLVSQLGQQARGWTCRRVRQQGDPL